MYVTGSRVGRAIRRDLETNDGPMFDINVDTQHLPLSIDYLMGWPHELLPKLLNGSCATP